MHPFFIVSQNKIYHVDYTLLVFYLSLNDLLDQLVLSFAGVFLQIYILCAEFSSIPHHLSLCD